MVISKKEKERKIPPFHFSRENVESLCEVVLDLGSIVGIVVVVVRSNYTVLCEIMRVNTVL